MCGGEGCTEFIGGDDACCTDDIERAGKLCSETGAAPCLTEIVVVESGPSEFNQTPHPSGSCAPLAQYWQAPEPVTGSCSIRRISTRSC